MNGTKGMKTLVTSMMAASAIRSCAGDHRPDCPILEELGQPDDGTGEATKRTGAVARRGRSGGPR